MQEWICAASKSEGGDDFESRRFESEEAAYAWLETQDGKHCWITPNPVRQGVGKACDADVLRAPWQLVDVDPPADTERVAREIFEAFGRCGKLNFSGRGHQVLLRVTPDVDRRRLAQYVQSEWKVDKGVGQDVSRLTRAVGFRNPRTGEVAETLEEGEGEVTAAVLELLTADWVPPAEVEIRGWDPSPASAEDLAAMPDGARRVWDSENADRSHRLFAFVKECLKAGLSPERTCRLAIEMPDSKLAQRDSAYWATTYASAARDVEALASLDTLPQDCLDADSAMPAYAPDVLRAAAELKASSPGRYSDLRRRLKNTKLLQPLSDWDRAVNDAARQSVAPMEPPDHVIRRIETPEGQFVGWLHVSGERESWLPRDQANSLLAVEYGDVQEPAAAAIRNPWVIASEPFQPRELPGRRWNVSRAQHIDPVAGPYPEWVRVAKVVGAGLDDAVRQSQWCRENGVECGGDYLILWLAFMFQDPAARVPWLMLYSFNQGMGKSTWAEAIRRFLLIGGAVSLNRWLTSERGFNSEAEGAVFGYVEEENVAGHRDRFKGRMKSIVTDDVLGWEGKGTPAHDGPNRLHVIQCTNDPRYLVIEEQDTRITTWEMLEIGESDRRDKAEIMADLEAQAPGFMEALLTMELPAFGDGRLAIPALTTELKASQGRASRDLLERFLEEHPEWVGWPLRDLHDRFMLWMPESESRRAWPIGKVESNLDKQPKSLRSAWRLAQVLPDSYEGPLATLGEPLGWTGKRTRQAFEVLASHIDAELLPRRSDGRWARVGDVQPSHNSA